MASLKETLAQHPFLKGFNPAFLQFLAENAVKKQFDSGHYLLREGEETHQFFLIQQGKVALGTFILGRGVTTIQTLDDGELVGWSWLIPPHQWRFSALAITPVSTIAFEAQPIRQKCEDDHDFGYDLLKRMALVIGQRLTATRMRLDV
jgi:CRP-like cAMP-binding protein